MRTQLSEKQLAANRANAARSTGPRSSEGKSRSARNSFKHGICSASFTSVSFEDLALADRLRDDAILHYQPINSEETLAVEQIALHQLQMLRAARLEAGLFEEAVRRGAPDPTGRHPTVWPAPPKNADDFRAQQQNLSLATGFDILASNWKGWQIFLRYQAQAERLYRRAVADFERLKAQRDNLPNEPISEDEVLSSEPLPPDPNEPTDPRGAGLQAGHAGNPAGIAPEVPPAPAQAPAQTAPRMVERTCASPREVAPFVPDRRDAAPLPGPLSRGEG